MGMICPRHQHIGSVNRDQPAERKWGGRVVHPLTHTVSVISRDSFVWQSCHCHNLQHTEISLVVLLVEAGLGYFCWGPGPCLGYPHILVAGFCWDAPRPQALHCGISIGPCDGILRTWWVWGVHVMRSVQEIDILIYFEYDGFVFILHERVWWEDGMLNCGDRW